MWGYRSQSSVVGTAPRLRFGQYGVWIPVGQEIILSFKRPHQLWIRHKLLLIWCRRFFMGVKRQGVKLKHSTPSSFKVKNEWNCTSLPPICLQTRTREILPFTSYVLQDTIFIVLDTTSCFSVWPVDNITVATRQDVRGRSDWWDRRRRRQQKVESNSIIRKFLPLPAKYSVCVCTHTHTKA
jgi:hypothetical protein